MTVVSDTTPDNYLVLIDLPEAIAALRQTTFRAPSEVLVAFIRRHGDRDPG